MKTTRLPKGRQLRATNSERLTAAAAAMGVELAEPIDTNTVFRLLRELGYAASRERLDYHLRSGKLVAPRKVLGHFAWSERTILNFADSLEATRAWRPMSALVGS